MEVTRSLLMLPDEPEAQAWRAREEAYRARLLAVALEGAALHHQFAMVRYHACSIMLNALIQKMTHAILHNNV